MTYQLIETKTLGSNAAQIEFTSIPQDATDLLVLINARAAFSATTLSGGLFINTIASDVNWRRLSGNGSSVSSASTGASEVYLGEFPASNATNNTFGNISVYIPNYTGSQQKSFSVDGVSENNGTASEQTLVAAVCTKTAAITSLTVRVYSGSADLVAGSTISLYKITRGSSNGVVVS